METPTAADPTPRDSYDRSRRDFLDTCAKLSVALPPAVALLASSPHALASGGRVSYQNDQGEDHDSQGENEQ